MFPDNDTAEQWFIETRWPDGVRCAHCESDNIRSTPNHPTMPFYCNGCRRYFSVKTNSVMHSSKLGYQVWAIAMYQVATNIKGTSSLKLHRDLGITQKAAWHMLHRIRESFRDTVPIFTGPTEADETYIGGLERNRHASQRRNRGRGPVNMQPVAGVRDRETGQVSAAPVERVNRQTLQEFVHSRTEPTATVYTDEARAYIGLNRHHEAVRHSAGEYVRGMAHTNGLESFWAMLKRGYQGIYHWMSVKHLHRYVAEFEGRHNQRPQDTIEQMRSMVLNSVGKRLRYIDLIGPVETRHNGQLRIL